MTPSYLILINTILLSHSLNRSPIDFIVFGLVSLFVILVYTFNRFIRHDRVRLFCTSALPFAATIAYYSIYSGLNIKYAFYFLPLFQGQILLDLNYLKKFNSSTYLVIETSIPIVSTYFWWNTDIPLALWVIYLFLNGLFFFEKYNLIKQGQKSEASRKNTSLIWIQNIFALFYSFSFLIY